VPDESTVRKLTRRIGPETVKEITRVLIVQATRSRRFRPRAIRIDSTVIEADVKYPTDAGLASNGVGPRAGSEEAREAGEGAQAAGPGSPEVDGSHVAGGDPHDPSPLGRGEG